MVTGDVTADRLPQQRDDSGTRVTTKYVKKWIMHTDVINVVGKKDQSYHHSNR